MLGARHQLLPRRHTAKQESAGPIPVHVHVSIGAALCVCNGQTSHTHVPDSSPRAFAFDPATLCMSRSKPIRLQLHHDAPEDLQHDPFDRVVAPSRSARWAKPKARSAPSSHHRLRTRARSVDEIEMALDDEDDDEDDDDHSPAHRRRRQPPPPPPSTSLASSSPRHSSPRPSMEELETQLDDEAHDRKLASSRRRSLGALGLALLCLAVALMVRRRARASQLPDQDAAAALALPSTSKMSYLKRSLPPATPFVSVPPSPAQLALSPPPPQSPAPFPPSPSSPSPAPSSPPRAPPPPPVPPPLAPVQICLSELRAEGVAFRDEVRSLLLLLSPRLPPSLMFVTP